ncbi:Aspartyl/glutamyl-tRNA(Asn/Gln) amidotransferase subunit B [Pedobacter sp. Bi27]|uniref:Asp-tRNA(Asn)/Glu-tRNA(Gln) amidotransferase subunit GatB n=1 Tax=unclassified Pedobacter TaxID=2628915 RepID=UPI001D1DE7B6|nr:MULTISPECIES: Asp-tRNA(Asn)/Glu-tRNA(Gln) amidotransferase subunit GatB [unclassified Pedobacter]CAH0145171.1 Aspartyl/glutamyl-tRNA(Asn/Gln) amidotransferase subunit B [Pedobacter sp. Bi36]CAH0201036.1 Aspartyl/glutamyl-tRNA(Asn/Gln) amidotransferase subunit B [Pedobacter sp. Bi126]CAH0259662.1 Aspartyl/glutamyl-tRNA(Asn/Gln) amidotransferase subunit B [Pedobacter sp. Bi27]
MSLGTSENNYELVSGLEIHVQLNTNTKIFSADSASFGALPNQNISTVSLALPGALPKLNKEVVAKAIRIGLALNCTINQTNHFDRKNYFYADLPKGYQITQDNQPICVNGFLELQLADGPTKKIGINRIHLEEDAGKSIHDQDDNYSLVDLNRAGVPLIEIVTEPDIRSSEEASVLLSEIRKLVRHLNVSDGNMEEGSLRCDANISIRPQGTTEFGTRCEVKNLNSMRNVRRAMDFEFGRQVEVISNGGRIIQSTLNFDADKGTTSPMRTKEEANDYRYFSDPDLQPIYISDDWLAEIKSLMPALPNEISQQMVTDFGISKADAALFAEDLDLLNYFNKAQSSVHNKKSLINWLIGPIRAVLNEKGITISDFKVNPEQLAEAINLVDDKKITQQIAIQQLLPAVELEENAKVNDLAQSLNLLISENGDELSSFIDEVLNKYPQQVEAYKKGKKGVLGLFVGDVMKLAKGKADAKKLNELILEKLK